jgi:hypothetical protein
MNKIQILIDETKKGCGVETKRYTIYKWYKKKYITEICGEEGLLCSDCQSRLSALQSCQTIIEDRDKEELGFLSNLDKGLTEMGTIIPHIKQRIKQLSARGK